MASLLFALVLFFGEVREAEAARKTRIKFSTLAPEGSSWMKVMRMLEKEIVQATGGEVGFKFYPGGVSGDEVDVIRKMRIGQIHAAGFTGVGLGEILPEVRVLDLPFLFRSDREVEYIYEKMNDYFAARFEEKGYILLGWVPVGWVYFFSQEPISTIDSLRPKKAWMWEGDPLVQETYIRMGVSPHPLSVTDVLLSLQTGVVDTVYASPMGALALQWFTKVEYMSELRMAYATGAVLMTQRSFKRLSPENQKKVKNISKQYLKQLVKKIQQDNHQAITLMKQNGLKSAPLPDKAELQKFYAVGQQVQDKMNGKLFGQSVLDRIHGHLKTIR
ncbi:MAG: ABC transporter substrate-binding protein [Nitrospinaceae bacterium]|nr:ABC transporter substrate-binding protein [Nitrospinaceae bacterium]NIR55737.1 ABC transporter substrate-binding protein [Nitrospinaceae bacterium]NIS86177.1 ABC transporter substrate-binding protein [Nitrospinaceae bacterium]NIT83016.1 ABC transporter substrate-binding protein [Nitrospinaceae bacterium]NIU45228.1 ABC transporter substrate-binding protein [Nitrospinaceae bacterium]